MLLALHLSISCQRSSSFHFRWRCHGAEPQVQPLLLPCLTGWPTAPRALSHTEAESNRGGGLCPRLPSAVLGTAGTHSVMKLARAHGAWDHDARRWGKAVRHQFPGRSLLPMNADHVTSECAMYQAGHSRRTASSALAKAKCRTPHTSSCESGRHRESWARQGRSGARLHIRRGHLAHPTLGPRCMDRIEREHESVPLSATHADPLCLASAVERDRLHARAQTAASKPRASDATPHPAPRSLTCSDPPRGGGV